MDSHSKPSSSSAASVLASLVVVLAALAAAYYAYQQGYLDPVIEKIGVYIFKTKAKAEEKEKEAEGLQAGEDFLRSQLEGSKQAEDVKLGVGGIGGLKKNI